MIVRGEGVQTLALVWALMMRVRLTSCCPSDVQRCLGRSVSLQSSLAHALRQLFLDSLEGQQAVVGRSVCDSVIFSGCVFRLLSLLPVVPMRRYTIIVV